MENGSADGSLHDVCEDDTVMDGRVKVSLRGVSYKVKCKGVIRC